MNKKLIFIYDGQCPFCNQFAELLELKSNLPSLQIKDARENPPEIPLGYDMDIQGVILINDHEFLTGAQAINFVCSQINKPSDSLLEMLRLVFTSRTRSKIIFPILLIARRIALIVKGVPRKLADT